MLNKMSTVFEYNHPLIQENLLLRVKYYDLLT